jgi:hypothetical protein
MLWTETQRVGLAIIGLAIVVLLTYRLWTNPATIPDPLPAEGDRAMELTGRVDPNTADAATLAALPGIGRSVAARIVEYRDDWNKARSGTRAFQFIDDLKNVKGIGDATARALEPYLVFAADRPATRAVVQSP